MKLTVKLKAALAATAVCAMAAAGVLVLPGAASGKTATVIAFKNGKPTLKGITMNVINSAGSAHVADTNVHDWVEIMNSWGANVTQTNASKNVGELAVEGGKATVSVGPLPTQLDAGLKTFGPNQVHLTDALFVKKSIKSLGDLKGKTLAYCCTASPDGVMLHAILQKAHLKRSTLHLVATGASTASLDALIAGKVTAAFAAAATADATVAKTQDHELAAATTLLPEYADSFMASTPAWLKSHHKVAVAIDLAWLASAKLFNTNEKQWVKNAATYTSNADSTAQYETAWKQLRFLNGWPVTEKAYSDPVVTYNFKIAKELHTITGLGNRPRTQEITQSAWKAAWVIWRKHGKKL